MPRRGAPGKQKLVPPVHHHEPAPSGGRLLRSGSGGSSTAAKSVTDTTAACEVWASVSKATTSTPRATPCMRDAVFVELAQYATTESAVGALLSALLAVMRTAPEGAVGALFGTASMRDRVFVPIAPLVTSTHVLPFWEAVVGICKDGEARRLFATPGIRHCFFQLAKRVVTADAADWCARALCSITQPAEGAALFAVSHTVGMLHRLSKRGGLVTVLQTCCAFASILQHEPKVRVVFATPVMVKVFARLAEHAATGDAASVLFRDLFSFLKGKEAKTVFGAATGAVCGVFLRLAGRVVMSTAVTEACGCLYYVLQHSTPEAQAAFATEAVRDGVFLRLAIHACSTNAVVNLVGALCYLLHNNAKALAVFATSSVRDGVLVRLTKHAECARAVELLFRALRAFTKSESSRTVFATPAIRDGVVLPLAGRVRDRDGAIACLEAVTGLVGGDDEGAAARRAVFITTATSAAWAQVAEHAITARAALLLSSAVVWLSPAGGPDAPRPSDGDTAVRTRAGDGPTVPTATVPTATVPTMTVPTTTTVPTATVPTM